jgi:hypothetical protein
LLYPVGYFQVGVDIQKEPDDIDAIFVRRNKQRTKTILREERENASELLRI